MTVSLLASLPFVQWRHIQERTVDQTVYLPAPQIIEKIGERRHVTPQSTFQIASLLKWSMFWASNPGIIVVVVRRTPSPSSVNWFSSFEKDIVAHFVVLPELPGRRGYVSTKPLKIMDVLLRQRNTCALDWPRRPVKVQTLKTKPSVQHGADASQEKQSAAALPSLTPLALPGFLVWGFLWPLATTGAIPRTGFQAHPCTVRCTVRDGSSNEHTAGPESVSLGSSSTWVSALESLIWMFLSTDTVGIQR